MCLALAMIRTCVSYIEASLHGSRSTDCCTGGGQDTWSVQLTGIDNSVASVDDNDSNDNPSPVKSSNTASTSPTATPSPSITTKVQPSVVTQAGTVKTVTASAAPVENDRSTSVTSSKQDSGPNKAAIAAGVVVGLVTMGTIIGALVFFLRRRKQRTLKEEYRQDSKNTYIGGAKQTIPTSASSVSDSRLEPSVMMQRRQSDGSIADNQDYSRRILKVSTVLTPAVQHSLIRDRLQILMVQPEEAAAAALISFITRLLDEVSTTQRYGCFV